MSNILLPVAGILTGGRRFGLGAPSGGSGPGSPFLPLVTINAGQTVASMSNISLQALGGDGPLSNFLVSAGSSGATVTPQGWTYSGTIQSPPAGVGNTLRFGVINDPAPGMGGRPVFYCAGRGSDPVTFGAPHIRTQLSFDQTSAGYAAKSGITYWYTLEHYLPALRWSGSTGIIWDVHNTNAASVSTGPWESVWSPAGDVFPNANVFASFVQQAVVPGPFDEFYPWASDNSWSGTTSSFGQSWTSWPYPQNTWVKFLVKYRGDPTGNTGIFQKWIGVGNTWIQVVNLTNLRIGTNDPSTPGDYLKAGWDSLAAQANGEWGLTRSVGFYQDNGNTPAQFQTSSIAFP